MEVLIENPQKVPLTYLNALLERLNWLNEGPDTYETIDSVSIYASSETDFDYHPMVIWGVSLLDDGTQPIEIRFTDSIGRTKKVRINSGDTEFTADFKGGVGTGFRAQSRSGTQTLRGIVWLKRPFEPSIFAGGIRTIYAEVQAPTIPAYIW